MPRNYCVVDTSVLIDDPQSIYRFENSEVLIPFPVLGELDSIKKDPSDLGRNAKECIRALDNLEGDISEGAGLPNGSRLKVIPIESNGKIQKADDQIIFAAQCLKDKGHDVTLYSQDINMRVRAKSLKIKTSSINIQSIDIESDIYSGSGDIELADEDFAQFYDRDNPHVDLEDYMQGVELYPNQFLYITNDKRRQSVGIVKVEGGKYVLRPVSDFRHNKNSLSISPRNLEQNLAMNLMFDPNIHFVSLIGKAGTGKTLLALQAAIHMMEKEDKTIVVTKPTEAVGRRNIGFLPGGVDEKMEAWLGSVFDNLRYIYGDETYVQSLLDARRIKIDSISLFRGRSIPNSVIIVDELQNCSKLEAKTILTRAGDNTKIFVTADINQIDNPYVDQYSNGAAYCVEKLKHFDLVGHITLTKGERSALATLASENL